jgi:hypothetical protein
MAVQINQYNASDPPARAYGTRALASTPAGNTRTPAAFTVALGFTPSFVKITSMDGSDTANVPANNFIVIHSFLAEIDDPAARNRSTVIACDAVPGAVWPTNFVSTMSARDCGINLTPDGRGFTVGVVATSATGFAIDRTDNNYFWEAWA